MESKRKKGEGWTIKSVRDHEREGNGRRKGGEEKRREKYNGEGKKGEETKKKSGEPAARNELEVNQTYRSYCSRYHYHLLPNYYLQQLYIWTLCLVFLIRCTASDVPEQRNHLRSIYLSRVARCFLLVTTWYIRFLSGSKALWGDHSSLKRFFERHAFQFFYFVNWEHTEWHYLRKDAWTWVEIQKNTFCLRTKEKKRASWFLLFLNNSKFFSLLFIAPQL